MAGKQRSCGTNLFVQGKAVEETFLRQNEDERGMTQELRFGCGPYPNIPWELIAKRIDHVEALGFDSAWLGDHFVNVADPRDPWFESWTLLAALAERTTTIKIGVFSPITWRHPAFLARQALSADHISNGRMELGLGAGVFNDPSHVMTGIPDWSPSERVARFREYVEIVDKLLCNEVTTYEGRYYSLKDAIMNPRPIQVPRPPITVLAHGRNMLKHAARYADTWNTVGGNTDTFAEATRGRNKLLDTFCEEIGRDPHSLRRSYAEWDGEIGGLMSFFESEDNFRELVERFVDVGITEFIFLYPCREEQLPVFERIATEVIPELKDQYN